MNSKVAIVSASNWRTPDDLFLTPGDLFLQASVDQALVSCSLHGGLVAVPSDAGPFSARRLRPVS